MNARIHSVNVGRVRPVTWTRSRRTAFLKQPVAGLVAVGELGLDGDEQAMRTFHGGPDKAVYAFAREDLDRWEERLGGPLPDGAFSENLTTSGLDVNEAELGERWRLGGDGGPLLEVSSVRTPCATFRTAVGRAGFDNAGWLKRFAEDARPGPYLRVLEPGVVAAGDPVSVAHRPGHGVTVSIVFRALHGERALLPLLLDVDAVPAEIRAHAREVLEAEGA